VWISDISPAPQFARPAPAAAHQQSRMGAARRWRRTCGCLYHAQHGRRCCSGLGQARHYPGTSPRQSRPSSVKQDNGAALTVRPPDAAAHLIDSLAAGVAPNRQCAIESFAWIQHRNWCRPRSNWPASSASSLRLALSSRSRPCVNRRRAGRRRWRRAGPWGPRSRTRQ